MSSSKKREVLERYRNLLENNLVLTDDLLRWLKEKKALPEFVFDEVKVQRSNRQTFSLLFVFVFSLVYRRQKRIRNFSMVSLIMAITPL